VVRNKQLPELLQEALLSVNDDDNSRYQNIQTRETSAFGESGFAQFSQTKTAAPLRASGGANGQGSETIVAQAIAIAGNIIGRKPNYGGNGFGISHNLSHTLTRADRHAVAFQSNAGAGVCMPVCTELSPTQTRNAKHIAVLIQQKNQYIVRRLTPVECERLQGFSDNYTLVPYRGVQAKDTPRYAALGNSMAVPVMAWIGHRIANALSSNP
jgi:DNA (cytosine-5)-methyltransferase 1